MKVQNLKFKMQNWLIFIFLVVFLSLPFISSAAGLVPCGGANEDPCNLCHFFLMFQNIINFVFWRLVPPVAVLMLVIGGFLFFFAGSPAMLSRAKSIITATVIGLIIIYAAWLLINTFFVAIGVAEWTKLSEGWFKIDCTITP